MTRCGSTTTLVASADFRMENSNWGPNGPQAIFMAQWIKSTGEILNVNPDNGKSFTLKELKKYVGGYVEVIYTYERPRQIMCVDGEGKPKKKPFNQEASKLFGFDEIVGDVLICSEKEMGE